MAEINFKGKGLNQKIFSKKDLRATVGLKSSAFNAIMSNKAVAHVLDKASEQRVVYQAMKERAKGAGSRGFTKKDMKKVLGDIEHSGQFSHSEMHKLGEELIGGEAGARIIRENQHAQEGYREHKSSFKSEQRASKKPQQRVNMQKTIKSILEKDITKRTTATPVENKKQPENIQKEGIAPPNRQVVVGRNVSESAQKIVFSQSDKALNKVQEEKIIIDTVEFKDDEGNLIEAKPKGQEPSNNPENFGYIPKYLTNFYGDKNSEKIKSRLSKIQARAKDDESSEAEEVEKEDERSRPAA
jgi:hypothetical protein